MYELKYRDFSEMKDSEIQWIGDIPINWSMKKVSYVFNLIGSGSTPNTGNVYYYNNGEIPWLLTGDLNDGYIDDTSKKITTKAMNEISALKKYPANTLVIAMYGATIGKLGLLNIEACTNQACCCLSKPFNISTKYVFYWFMCNKRHIISMGYGGGQPNISKELISQLRLSVPKKVEQKKIANFLNIKTAQFDQIISKKEQLIEKLEEAKKSLISEVVTGKVKIVDGQLVERDASEMKDSGVEWLGMIPQGWKTEKMKYIGNAIIGLTYSPDDVTDEKGTLVFRSSNVQNGEITFDNNVYVDKKITPKLAVRDGDILICSRNGSRKLIGKNALIRKEHEGATFGAFMTIFRTSNYKFIHLVLNSTLFDYQAGSYLTSTVNQLTISNLNNMVIPFPPTAEQEEIQNYLNRKLELFIKSINLAQKQINNLKQAKQSLISEAVTGKIDLRDWKIIEEGELQ